MSEGYIQAESGQNGCFHDIAAEQQVPSRFLDLLQRDLIRLSDAHSQDHYLHHLPQIHTSDFKMPTTTSADTVTLEADVLFTVAGVTFDTSDLDSRDVTIPDSATRYLYAEVDADCGLMSDWLDDPITRYLTVSLTLEESEVASTATKMLILKAVKGGSGETPVVTAYANNGHQAVMDAMTAAGGFFSGETALRPAYNSASQLEFPGGAVEAGGILRATADDLSGPLIVSVGALSGDGVIYAFLEAAAGEISAGNITLSDDDPHSAAWDDARKGVYAEWGGKIYRHLGDWPYESGALVAGSRSAEGWAILAATCGEVAVTNGSWADVVLPGCPLIHGTQVITRTNAQAANVDVQMRGGSTDSLAVRTHTASTAFVHAQWVMTFGDGKVAAKGATTGQTLTTGWFKEAR